MNHRFFSKRQRKILQVISGNTCTICSKPLDENFHADHVVPFKHNGQTLLSNGQALCPSCNLRKGSKHAEY